MSLFAFLYATGRGSLAPARREKRHAAAGLLEAPHCLEAITAQTGQIDAKPPVAVAGPARRFRRGQMPLRART